MHFGSISSSVSLNANQSVRVNAAGNAFESFTPSAEPGGEAFPVGAVFISVVPTDQATLLGYGTWESFGAGRVLVGLDSGDTDFDTAEETGGAKTVAAAGSVAAPSISGNTAGEAAHTHSLGAHTHTYTDVPNHVHAENAPSSASGGALKFAIDTNASGTQGSGLDTGDPTGGVVTGQTNGPGSDVSGAGASHSHDATGLSASAPTFTGSPTSVVQPYIVVYMFKRTA